MTIEITLFAIMIYIFIGMAIFMGVIMICDHNKDMMSEDDVRILDSVKMMAQRKPLTLLIVLIVFGIIWLPLFITSHSGE